MSSKLHAYHTNPLFIEWNGMQLQQTYISSHSTLKSTDKWINGSWRLNACGRGKQIVLVFLLLRVLDDLLGAVHEGNPQGDNQNSSEHNNEQNRSNQHTSRSAAIVGKTSEVLSIVDEIVFYP